MVIDNIHALTKKWPSIIHILLTHAYHTMYFDCLLTLAFTIVNNNIQIYEKRNCIHEAPLSFVFATTQNLMK